MIFSDSIPANNDSLPGSRSFETWPGRSVDTSADLLSITFPKYPVPQSFFTTHSLKVRTMDPVPFHAFQPDWIPGLLLLCFVLLAWIQFFYRKRLHQLLLAPFSKRFLSQLVREGNLFSERISLALGVIYIQCIILFLYLIYVIQLKGRIPFSMSGFTFYMLIGVVFFIYWISKVAAIRFLGRVFRTYHATDEYLLNILIFNFLTGIIMLPFLVIIVYLKSLLFLYILSGIIAFLFLFRFVRGFLIGISFSKFSYLFLFVYLCSLEILPLIVLLKFFLKHYPSTI